MTDTEKKARLAAALRENLRKRKAQAREQANEAETAPGLASKPANRSDNAR